MGQMTVLGFFFGFGTFGARASRALAVFLNGT
jgi:hypothetical protein